MSTGGTKSATNYEGYKAVTIDATANARRNRDDYPVTTLTQPGVLTLKPNDASVGNVRESPQRHRNELNSSNAPHCPSARTLVED